MTTLATAALRFIALTPGVGDADLAVRRSRAALLAGATAIWLHEKELAADAARSLARELRRVCASLRAALIVSAPLRDDALAFALDCEADAVHLGGSDATPSEVRRIAPRGIAIGFSAHDPLDRPAIEAADYVTLSPFAPTPKARPRPALGAARFAELRATIARPVVALGGIDALTARLAFAAGADGVAVRRAAGDVERIVAASKS